MLYLLVFDIIRFFATYIWLFIHMIFNLQNYEPIESETPIDGPALPNPITPALPPHVTQPTSG